MNFGLGQLVECSDGSIKTKRLWKSRAGHNPKRMTRAMWHNTYYYLRFASLLTKDYTLAVLAQGFDLLGDAPGNKTLRQVISLR